MAEPDISMKTRLGCAARGGLGRSWSRTGSALADWYGGAAAEVPVDTISMDVRNGGAWQATMFAGGREIHWRGEYREAVEPERLVFTVTDEPGDVYDLITVVLTDLGDGRTEMLMEQSGGHMTPEQYGEAEKGWGGLLRPDGRKAGRRLTYLHAGRGEHAPASGSVDERRTPAAMISWPSAELYTRSR